MSSIIVIQQKRGVYFITDAGQYDPDGGALVGIRSKVYSSFPGNFAFAWRGAGGNWYDQIAKLIYAIPSFDALCDQISAIARDFYARAAAVAEEEPMPGGWDMEMTFAGFSDRGEEVSCVWLTSDEGDGTAAFTLRAAPALIVAPGPALPLESILGRRIDAAAVEALDPIEDGLKLIEAQRSSPQRGGFRVAAGRAELTAIGRRKIDRFVMREWPDEIGRPVEA